MNSHKSQRGAAALVISLVLVFGMTLVAFFGNRGMIFEQKTSANQYRSTRAFELAEAGLEWAVARLNDDLFVNAACVTPDPFNATAAPNSFRQRYLAPTVSGTAASFVVTAAPLHASCSINVNGQATCSCPASGTNPVLTNASDPRFAIRFNPDPGGDPTTVEIISFGCTSQGPECDVGSTATPDATAVVRSLFKVRPKLPGAAGAGLIAGSAATTGGNLRVINLDVKSNGITINSGTSIDMGTGTSVITLPGTPPSVSVLDNDFSLNDLTNADANGDLFFQSFMGQTQAQYQANPQTWRITGGSCGANVRCTSCGPNPTDSSCGAAVSAQINKGLTQFWVDTDVQFGSGNMPASGTLGTALSPITFASSASVKLTSNITAYGMFFVATASALDNGGFTGSGTAKIYGSFIARGNFVKGGNGTLDLIYDPGIALIGEMTGLLVRVPGSWRDKKDEFN